MTRVAIASDHVGISFKKELQAALAELDCVSEDLGTFSEERTDYPIFAEKLARKVASGEYEKGILVCGSGVGMSIAANKIRGARAVVCSEPYSAVLSRQHNNTNILCLGARVVGIELAKMILREWLAAEYEGGRHQRRIDLIVGLEEAERRD